jgi:hypothetical protein
MLAVISADLNKLIEDFALVNAPATLITAANAFQIFLADLQAHTSILLGNINYESTTGFASAFPPRPGNIYPESIRRRQIGHFRLVFCDFDR